MNAISRRRGVTLIELMIAVAISVLAIAAVYSLFIGQSRSMRGQQEITEIQENVRIAMDVLTRDIRNAGFGLSAASYAGIRIENDCGRTGHQLGLAGGLYNLGGSDIILDGNFVKALDIGGVSDACPNGSDRITLAFRPRMDVASGCSGGVCVTIGAGDVSNTYPVICRGTTSSATGDCCMAMEAICEGCSAPCRDAAGACVASGRIVFASPPSVTVCDAANPSACVLTEVIAADCNQGLGNTKVSMVELTANGVPFPNNAAQWSIVNGKDTGVEINGFIYRTYQLMDFDGPGGRAPDLVFSDRTYLDNNPGNEDPRWTVVASGIEELQFSYSLTNAPTTFLSRTLWNTPNGCVPAAGVDCLLDLTQPGASPPAAIRVSLSARSNTRELSNADTASSSIRRQLEDNNTAAAQPGGDGNLLGYRRRTLTEVVGLRNY